MRSHPAAAKLIPLPAAAATNQAGTAGQAAAVSNAVAARPSVQSGLTQAMDLVPGALQSLGSGGSFDPLGFFEAVLGTTTGQALNTYTMDVGNWALVISGPLFTASGITPLLGGIYGLGYRRPPRWPMRSTRSAWGRWPARHVCSIGQRGRSRHGRQVVGTAVLDVPVDPARGQWVATGERGPGWPTGGRRRRNRQLLRRHPPVGSPVNATAANKTRVRSGAGQKVIPTMPGEPGPDAPNPVAPGQAQPSRRHVASALSDREREELARLRKDIADAAMELDAAARLIKEAMLDRLLDFAALPPEVNSARMYAGPGAGSLAAAAAAWDSLAAELSSTAGAYREVVSGLTSGPWVGPSSGSMAAAVAPYLSWMTATAAQATQTASQLGSAVAAYETAFAATVPPMEIEVNRALLASLVDTNILGQNSAAIAATEAQYAQMWAQDAAAMYGYAGASAAATRLTSFSPAPQTTNQAGAMTRDPRPARPPPLRPARAPNRPWRTCRTCCRACRRDRRLRLQRRPHQVRSSITSTGRIRSWMC